MRACMCEILSVAWAPIEAPGRLREATHNLQMTISQLQCLNAGGIGLMSRMGHKAKA